MKAYTVTLRIVLEDELPHPEVWDWTQLLDLSPSENVEVLFVADAPTQPDLFEN